MLNESWNFLDFMATFFFLSSLVHFSFIYIWFFFFAFSYCFNIFFVVHRIVGVNDL
jgi:hypothetical protein